MVIAGQSSFPTLGDSDQVKIGDSPKVDREEIDLRRQFVYVLEIAETSYPDSGFLRSYSRLDATAPLDSRKLAAIGAALPLDGHPETATESQATDPPVAPRRLPTAVAITAGAVAVAAALAVVIIPAVWHDGDPSQQAPVATTPTPTRTQTGPDTAPPPTPEPPGEGNVIAVTPDRPDGCSTSYLVTGAVRAYPDLDATAIWVVDELYADPSHNDPHDLYFANARVTPKTGGTFAVRIPGNEEKGVRDGRFLLGLTHRGGRPGSRTEPERRPGPRRRLPRRPPDTATAGQRRDRHLTGSPPTLRVMTRRHHDTTMDDGRRRR